MFGIILFYLHMKEKIADEITRLKIEDKVMLLGVRSDIPELLQVFDVFVFPSFYEGLPVTLIEAQAAGLKIFASDTITKEVCLTTNLEFLSIKQTPTFWASKIIKEKAYKRIGDKQQVVNGGYDIVANSKKLQDFYLKEITS